MNNEIPTVSNTEDTDNKDETDDDRSESSVRLISTDSKKHNLANLSIQSFDDSTVHFRARSVLEGITPTEQKEIAADMFSQMKQLKAHNEVMGYHGFSGLLQRHDSNMNITDNNNNNNNKTNEFIISQSKLNGVSENENDTYSDDTQNTNLTNIQKSVTFVEHRNELNHHKNMVLSETQSLRQKLETISMSVNKIRQDLENQNNETNVFNNISVKQLNETIMFFQNHLTEIQDQIEDAENDIESNIDVQFLKYMEEIKMNKQKIKSMKKEKKQKEKQLQMNKEKDQKKIIALQRLQIEQLMRAKSDGNQLQLQFSSSPRSPSPNTKRRRNSTGSLPTIDDLHELYNDNNNNNNNKNNNSAMHYDDNMHMDDHDMNYISPANHLNTIASYPNYNTQYHDTQMSQIPMNSEGQYAQSGYIQYQNSHSNKYQSRMQLTTQPVSPLLSDNAIKIVAGVAIFLSGLWIISKYIDNGKVNNNMSSAIYRGPRFKY